MGSANVIDDSISYIVISLVKDGQVIKEATKELTIKLQNFVNVEIDGKSQQLQTRKIIMLVMQLPEVFVINSTSIRMVLCLKI